MAKAALPASALPGSTSNSGAGDVKWKIGSATPQNISPMPKPADSSIAYHETVENSGRANGPPSLIFPKRLKAKYSATSTKMLKSRM